MTLTLLAFGAIAAAAYLTWSVDTRLSAARRGSTSFESAYAAAVHETYELRSAQQAYVAAGQSESFWIAKASTSLTAIRAALETLSLNTESQAVRAAAEAAAEAVDGFEQIDRRARTYATTGQKLLASDIIFSDGLEAATNILAALHDVQQLTIADTQAATRAARLEWMIALAASAGVVSIALLLLTGVPPPESDATTDSKIAPARDGVELRLRPEVPKAQVPEPQPATTVARPARSAEKTSPGLRDADLLGLASICSDLARLSDTGALPSILERAAKTLDATGLVLWVVDPDGKELMPVAAHGYPVSMLARLGSINVHSENATAAAFRTGLLQTVKGDTDAEGAIAAPLVGAAGARGVMSAEVRHGGERQPTRLATASIVAAQLATLVGPPAARAQDRGSAAL
jgi:hypothetical protein